MANIKLKIITPSNILYDADNIHMITAPGYEGEFGILPGHIPLLISLKTGYIKVYNQKEEIIKKFPIATGICQVKEDLCTIFIEKTKDKKPPSP